MVKAVRGAIQIEEDSPEAIARGVAVLYDEIKKRNHIQEDQIISLIISQTDDLSSYNPATALREHGVDGIALFCLQELKVQNQLPKTIRFLLHIQDIEKETVINHVYLGGAESLRPDLC